MRNGKELRIFHFLSQYGNNILRFRRMWEGGVRKPKMAAPKLLLSGICRVESNKHQQNSEESTAIQAQLIFLFFYFF